MPDHRYPKKSYDMLLQLTLNGKTSWVSQISSIIYNHGFGYIWGSQVKVRIGTKVVRPGVDKRSNWAIAIVTYNNGKTSNVHDRQKKSCCLASRLLNSMQCDSERNVSESVIGRLWQFPVTGTLNNRPRSGRPPSTTLKRRPILDKYGPPTT